MNPRPARPTQDTPEALVNRLMANIRNQFCLDLDEKAWYKDHYHFIKRYVVLWPARFMFKKGFTLPADRYEAILRDILAGIKRHGDTAAVRYWPAYLMKCVQDHWAHHWEEYYIEAKSLRSIAERALFSARQAAPATLPDLTTETLAQAAAVLSRPRRKKSHAPRQLDLI